ncbi:unnamed protein product, partial [Arctogadus glacialis]
MCLWRQGTSSLRPAQAPLPSSPRRPQATPWQRVQCTPRPPGHCPGTPSRAPPLSLRSPPSTARGGARLSVGLSVLLSILLCYCIAMHLFGLNWQLQESESYGAFENGAGARDTTPNSVMVPADT